MDHGQTPPEMTLRRATVQDLDSLVSLGLTAMPLDPQWNYRYPRREEFPVEHRACVKERWGRLFGDDPDGGEWVVLFVEYRRDDHFVGERPLPIAFSVWHFPSRQMVELPCNTFQPSGKHTYLFQSPPLVFRTREIGD